MKPLKAFTTLMLAGLVLTGVLYSKPASASVSFDFFYSNLSHHGQWLASASYGRVWQPSTYYSGWNPYYDGHWVYTDVGWCWDSDYDWGAIPYHYGTWVYDPYYGWVWVPGYTWAPSWVVWSTAPDYIGWAPVLPSFSVGLSFHFGDYDRRHFVFVRSHDFLCDRVRSYAIPPSRTSIIINKTRIINNIAIQNNVVVNRGPDRTFVERTTRERIRPVPVERVRSLRAFEGSRFDRRQIMVSPDRARRGLRAADPVPVRAPLPERRGRGGLDRGERSYGSSDVQERRRGPREPRFDRQTREVPGRDRDSGTSFEGPDRGHEQMPPHQRFGDSDRAARGRRGPSGAGTFERDRNRDRPRGYRGEDVRGSGAEPRRLEAPTGRDRDRALRQRHDEGSLFRGLNGRSEGVERADRAGPRERRGVRERRAPREKRPHD